MKVCKRMICLIIAASLSLLPVNVSAAVPEWIEVTGYSPDVDYMALMIDVLRDGSEYALIVGSLYESQRNMKIDGMGLHYKKTDCFSRYASADEILVEIQKSQRPDYSEEDVDLLARLIYAEAGCTWFPEWVEIAVGSVVLNRVASAKYPNTIREVIYQPGQYGPAWSGSIERRADERTINNARFLMENGSQIPENVLGQNGTGTGNGIWKTYYDSVLGTTIYFTYG